MNDKGFEINVEEVLKLFKDLDYKEQIKSFKTALRKSSAIIYKLTKKNLKAKLGASSSHVGKYGKMNAGIKNRVSKNGKMAKVHIMGDFRLKWFEMGTKERFLKSQSKHGTGKITALYFFKSAVTEKQKEAEGLLMRNLEESIKKIYNKHK